MSQIQRLKTEVENIEIKIFDVTKDEWQKTKLKDLTKVFIKENNVCISLEEPKAYKIAIRFTQNGLPVKWISPDLQRWETKNRYFEWQDAGTLKVMEI